MIRLGTLGAYPLTDNTEARYAEVAREMASSGQWITPQLHGMKFWAKPPLSVWAAALFMKAFGTSEFAVRLAPLIPSLLTLWLVYSLAAYRDGRERALMATLILSSSALFFVSSGAVMTDAMLSLGTTLSMAAFWRAMDGGGPGRRAWGYLFFVGLAVGLLAKGPVGLVLTGIPLFLWMMRTRRFRELWSRLPWARGLLLTAILTLPWYLAAEARTPGFLDYFLVGEHWKRFTQPGWAGDLYGSAHRQPLGAIWLFWVMAAFPWSLWVLGLLAQRMRKIGAVFSGVRKMDDETAYLLLWALSPMLLFSLCGNILWTYILPGLPALALLLAGYRSRGESSPLPEGGVSGRTKGFLAVGLLTPLLFGLLIFLWSFMPFKASQKFLVADFRARCPEAGSRLVYLYDRPYSAEFYSGGKALMKSSLPEIRAQLADGVPDFFAVTRRQLFNLPAELRWKLSLLAEYDDFLLLREKNDC